MKGGTLTSMAETVMSKVPSWVGTPLMVPSLLISRPGGMPSADQM